MHRAAHRILKSDPVMAALIDAAGPCRIRSREVQEPFEALARAIAHQQLHGVAAERILGRFIALFEAATFPAPQQVSMLPTRNCAPWVFPTPRLPRSRIWRARRSRARCRPLPNWRCSGIWKSSSASRSVRGIGRWTVEMMLMFQLERRDVLPVDDFGVGTAFASPMDSRHADAARIGAIR